MDALREVPGSIPGAPTFRALLPCQGTTSEEKGVIPPLHHGCGKFWFLGVTL